MGIINYDDGGSFKQTSVRKDKQDLTTKILQLWAGPGKAVKNTNNEELSQKTENCFLQSYLRLKKTQLPFWCISFQLSLLAYFL